MQNPVHELHTWQLPQNNISSQLEFPNEKHIPVTKSNISTLSFSYYLHITTFRYCLKRLCNKINVAQQEGKIVCFANTASSTHRHRIEHVVVFFYGLLW